MNTTNFEDDEIDLRAIILTLWKGKWWIIGVSLVLAVSVYAFSKLFLPKQYEATAMVFVAEPVFSTNLDSAVQTNIITGITSTDMAFVDDLLMEVYQDPNVAPLLDPEKPFYSLKDSLEATIIGSHQMRLTVVDSDPERAAALVNAWANLFTQRLNMLSGLDEESIDNFEALTSSARQNWDEAEQALIEYLPEGQIPVLKIHFQRASESLEINLKAIDTLDRLIDDVELLNTQLQGMSAGKQLPLQDALSFLALRQRAVGTVSGIEISIPVDTAAELMGEGYTVSQARSDLQVLITALQTQRQIHVDLADADAATVTALSVDLESAQYQFEDLAMQRNLSQDAYDALAHQVVESKISLERGDQAARVVGLALPPDPENPSGPRSAVNGAIAGAAGFLLSSAVIFLINWWRSSEPLKANQLPTQPANPGTPE